MRLTFLQMIHLDNEERESKSGLVFPDITYIGYVISIRLLLMRF